jgi:hypothetical protein
VAQHRGEHIPSRLDHALMWYEQSRLPFVEGMEHCYTPYHVWIDEGRISSNVNMHPFVIRAAWLESAIRNGSGNGGGVIIAFLVRVRCLWASFFDSAQPNGRSPIRGIVTTGQLGRTANSTRTRPRSIIALARSCLRRARRRRGTDSRPRVGTESTASSSSASSSRL